LNVDNNFISPNPISIAPHTTKYSANGSKPIAIIKCRLPTSLKINSRTASPKKYNPTNVIAVIISINTNDSVCISANFERSFPIKYVFATPIPILVVFKHCVLANRTSQNSPFNSGPNTTATTIPDTAVENNITNCDAKSYVDFFAMLIRYNLALLALLKKIPPLAVFVPFCPTLTLFLISFRKKSIKTLYGGLICLNTHFPFQALSTATTLIPLSREIHLS
jgi:hypothetical protein